MEQRKVSLGEFWKETGASLAFGVQRFLRMLADSHENKEDLSVFHGDENFIITWESVDEYFKTHPKPKRPMNLQQEVEFLRGKVKEYEKEKKRGERAKKAAEKEAVDKTEDEPFEIEEPKPPVSRPLDEPPPLELKDTEEAPVPIPARDPHIPRRDEPTYEDIKKELAADLKGKGIINEKLQQEALKKGEKRVKKQE